MSTATPHSPHASTVDVKTFFSPQDDTEGAYKAFLSSARKSIRIAIFSFTLEDVATLLAQKARAKVAVQLMMDRTQADNPESKKLLEDLEQAGVQLKLGISPMPAGAPTINDNRRVLHIKATIVDEEAVWDGSWNYSKSASAEANTANLVRDPARAKQFAAFFDYLWKNMAELRTPPAPMPESLGQDYRHPAEWQSSPGMSYPGVHLETLFVPEPYQAVEHRLVELLGKATHSIDVLIYELRLKSLVDALAARARGKVPVRVLLDSSMYEKNDAELSEEPFVKTLLQAGASVWVGTSPEAGQIMHVKAVVLDQKTVWDGSWNFTPSANYQANNVNLITNPQRAKDFTTYFDFLAKTAARAQLDAQGQVTLVGGQLPVQKPGKVGGGKSVA